MQTSITESVFSIPTHRKYSGPGSQAKFKTCNRKYLFVENLIPTFRLSTNQEKIVGWLLPSPLDSRIESSSGKSILPAIGRIKASYSGSGGNSKEEFFPPFFESAPSSPHKKAAQELHEILTHSIVFRGKSSNFSLYTSSIFQDGTSVAHLSLEYEESADFIMMPSANHMKGFSLDDLLAIHTRNGTKSPLIVYGPHTVDMFQTIGWNTLMSPASPHHIVLHDHVDFKAEDIKPNYESEKNGGTTSDGQGGSDKNVGTQSSPMTLVFALVSLIALMLLI